MVMIVWCNSAASYYLIRYGFKMLDLSYVIYWHVRGNIVLKPAVLPALLLACTFAQEQVTEEKGAPRHGPTG